MILFLIDFLLFLYSLLIFCTFTVYVNALIPNLMTKYFDWFVVKSILDTLADEVKNHIYSGVFCDRASAAFALNIGFAISLSRMVNRPDDRKKYIGFMLYFLGALIFAGKRSLMIIPVIMIISILLFKTQSKAGRRVLSVFLVLGVLGFVALSYITNISVHFTRASNTIESRTDILWPVAISMLKSYPLTGTGINTFNSVIQQSYGGNILLGNWNYHAHNIYVQLLGELGLFMGTFVIGCFVNNIYRTINGLKNWDLITSKRENLTCSFLFQVLWLVYGLSGNTFYYSTQFLCYAISISILGELYEKENWNFDISSSRKLWRRIAGIRFSKGAPKDRRRYRNNRL